MRSRTILALGALLLAGSLPAQGFRGGPGGPGGMPLDDAGFPPTIPMLTQMLQLTPAQAAQAVPLRDSMLAESREARTRAVALRDALRAARQGGAPADSVAALQQRLQSAMMGLMPYRIAFHASLRPLLTPEQVQLMDARQQEQMQRMGQRHPG